jgi:LAGLIDADG DNA endonuclease family
MDDGGRGANTPKGQIISVRGFEKEEQELLKKCLFDNYNLEVNLHKNGQIYFPVKSIRLFHQILAPLMIPSMRYKLSITP